MPSPRLAGIAVVLALATGCATARKGEPIVWPPPPDKPRVKFVRSISTEKDLDVSAWRTFARAIVPRDADDVLKNPTGLAFSPDETKLYVATGSRGLVFEIDLAENSLRRFPMPEGSAAKVPFGVATDAEGNLYVSDSGDAAVWVYSTRGKLLRRFGKGVLERPTGIALDRRRQIVYVVEGGSPRTQHHAVEVFAEDGRHLRTIGRRGTQPGEFNFPSYAAVGPEGNLYVSDMLNFRIQVFDPDGGLFTVFGVAGVGPGAFGKLKGIAFDRFGNLHVADGDHSLVQMFNPKLQPLMAYGGFGKRVEFMMLPNAIAIDSKNNIFVADFFMNRVNQYALFDTRPEDSFLPPPGAAASPVAPGPSAGPPEASPPR